MTDLHQALGLSDPSRMAIYRRTAELVALIAENAIDCLFGKAAAEAKAAAAAEAEGADKAPGSAAKPGKH